MLYVKILIAREGFIFGLTMEPGIAQAKNVKLNIVELKLFI